jgi:hypothetical protein
MDLPLDFILPNGYNPGAISGSIPGHYRLCLRSPQMYLLTLLIGAVLAYLAAASLLHRVRLPAIVQVLGGARWHFLVFGVLVGLGLRLDESVSQYLPKTTRGLVGIALVWVGLETGLSFDLRRFRRIPVRRTGAEAAFVLIAALLSAGIAYLLLPTMATHLGFTNPPGLAMLALAGFVASVRMPELLPLWRGGSMRVPSDAATSLSALANPAVLIAYGLSFPAVAAGHVFTFGPFEAVGQVWWLVAILGSGLVLGICIDFLFRAHRDGARCVFLSLAAIMGVSGACLSAGIPGLVTGFVGGAWLINATVRRREVLELSERVGAVFEPILFVLAGCLLAVNVGLDLRMAVVLSALGLFAIRGIVRTVSAWIAWRVAERSDRLLDTLGFGWRPAGVLAVSILVQSILLVPEGDALSRLVAPAIFSVFLTQLVPSPAHREPRTAGPPSRQTAEAAS